MATIELELPDAWITEDNVLFIVATGSYRRDIDNGNKALESWKYPGRLSFADTPFSKRHTVIWVNPAYIAQEKWPFGTVTKSKKLGWVRLWKIDAEEL